VVGGVIHVYVEVAGDEEFMRCGCCSGEKRCEFIQKGRERFPTSNKTVKLHAKLTLEKMTVFFRLRSPPFFVPCIMDLRLLFYLFV